MTYVVATETRVPEHYYTQETLANMLRRYCMAMGYDFELDVIDSLFANTRINGRYFGQPLDNMYAPPPLNQSNTASVGTAVDLLADAVTSMLAKADVEASTVNQLTTVASTMIALPTIGARVMNLVPFAPTMRRTPISGLGCMGGGAGVVRVHDYLRGNQEDSVVLMSCEMGGTGLWQGGIQGYLELAVDRLREDPSKYSELISQIVSSGLFGDGAATVLLVGDDHPKAKDAIGPRIVDTASVMLPQSGGIMEMQLLEKGFMNVLSPDIPKVATQVLRDTLDNFLEANSITQDDIGLWMIHPGGPKILELVTKEFELTEKQMALSYEILGRVGNVSAPTVLFMLDEVVANRDVEPGTYGLMVAMGPGFSEELILFQW